MAGGATSNMILFIIYSMAAGILSQRLEKYTKIPYTVLLTVFGIACDVVLQDSIFDHASDSWEKIDLNVLLAIFIMPLVFESALKVHFFIFDKAKYQIFLLAMPILGLSTLLTGITLKALVLGFGESVATLFTWNHSFLLGTILSATDPVAVVALLEHVGASPVLSTTIEGESLFNDGTAMVLFFILLEMCKGREVSAGSISYTLFRLTIVAVLVGWTVGHVASEMIGRFKNDTTAVSMITFTACFLTYYVSAIHIHGHIGPLCSEILATVVCGLNIAGIGKKYASPSVWASVMSMWGFIANVLNTILFVLLGAHVNDILFREHEFSYLTQQSTYTFVIFACILSPVLYIALHVIRIFSIGIFFPILKKLGYGITFNEILFVTFAGLRGAIGLGLGLAILRQKDEYFPVEVKSVFIIEIGMIVLMTLFINANLIPKLLVHLKLLEKEEDDFTSVADRECRKIFQNAIREALQEIKERSCFQHVEWNNVLPHFPIDWTEGGTTADIETSFENSRHNLENAFGKRLQGEEEKGPEIGRGNDNDSVVKPGLYDKSPKKYTKKIRRFYQRRILALLENIRHSFDIQRRPFLTLLGVEEYVYDNTHKPFSTFGKLLNKLLTCTLKSKPGCFKRIAGRCQMPFKLSGSEQYECLLVFLHIHSSAHESLLRIKLAEEASMGARRFLSRRDLSDGLSTIASVPELVAALDTVLSESSSMLEECQNLLLEVNQNQPNAVKAYENALAYYTLRKSILNELHEHVEDGEMTENVYRSFLRDLKRVSRQTFYYQHKEFWHVMDLKFCRKSKAPSFAFDILQLHRYVSQADRAATSNYVELADSGAPCENNLGEPLLESSQ